MVSPVADPGHRDWSLLAACDFGCCIKRCMTPSVQLRCRTPLNGPLDNARTVRLLQTCDIRRHRRASCTASDLGPECSRVCKLQGSAGVQVCLCSDRHRHAQQPPRGAHAVGRTPAKKRLTRCPKTPSSHQERSPRRHGAKNPAAHEGRSPLRHGERPSWAPALCSPDLRVGFRSVEGGPGSLGKDRIVLGVKDVHLKNI